MMNMADAQLTGADESGANEHQRR